MNGLPDNIKRIDILRVEYNKNKLCKCFNPHYEIDYQNKLVYCKDCGAIVEPFEALYNIARQFDRISEQIEFILNQKKTILNYKPHLEVIKNIEEHYKSGNMIPMCPHCNYPFDLKDLISWVNRNCVRSDNDG